MRSVCNLIITVIILASICCKKKEITVIECKKKEIAVIENVPPEPLIKGSCVNDPLEFHGNNMWFGNTRCAYQGYYWICPTNSPESARICKREQPIPAENAK